METFVKRRPELALAAVTLLWGSTFIVTKGIVHRAPPLAYVALRFGSAALVLLVLVPRTLRAPRVLLRDGALLGLLQGLGLWFQVVGQVYTTASKVAFTTAFSVTLTPLVGLALYGERPSRAQALGVLLATFGLYLLNYPAAGADWNRGDLWAGGCAVIYAVVIVETAHRTRGVDVPSFTTVQTATAALLFLAGLGVTQLLCHVLPPATWPEILRLEARPFPWSGKMALALTYMSLVCTVVTFLGQTWAMGRMSATAAAVVFALEPVFATALAIAVEGRSEWPGTRGVLGATLVLGGVFAAERRAPVLGSAKRRR